MRHGRRARIGVALGLLVGWVALARGAAVHQPVQAHTQRSAAESPNRIELSATEHLIED